MYSVGFLFFSWVTRKMGWENKLLKVGIHLMITCTRVALVTRVQMHRRRTYLHHLSLSLHSFYLHNQDNTYNYSRSASNTDLSGSTGNEHPYALTTGYRVVYFFYGGTHLAVFGYRACWVTSESSLGPIAPFPRSIVSSFQARTVATYN